METAARELKEAGEEAARVREDFRQQLEALGHQVIGKRDAELRDVDEPLWEDPPQPPPPRTVSFIL